MAANKDNTKPDPKDPKTFDKLDDAFSEADIEDRLWVFWNRYKKPVSTAITIALVVILGSHGYKWYVAKQKADLTAAYHDAGDDIALKSFADANDGTELAGVAYLRLADESYEKGEYSTAADLYAKAAADFELSLFSARAKLGQGMSLLLNGDTDMGMQVFEGVAADPKVPTSFKAEAMYHQLVQLWEQGDLAGAHAKLESLNAAGDSYWSQKAQRLFDTVPELMEVQQG